jgi:hypothetical protein
MLSRNSSGKPGAGLARALSKLGFCEGLLLFTNDTAWAARITKGASRALTPAEVSALANPPRARP